MPLTLQNFCINTISLVLMLAIFWGCSDRSDQAGAEEESDNPTTEMDSSDTGGATDDETDADADDTSENGGITENDETTTLFTVIGDVPYNDAQRKDLIGLIEAHNDRGRSQFVVHVGDIKAGGDACDEPKYKDVQALLLNLEAPTFIVLGDNEYNDCARPEDALALWNRYFLQFNKNWDFPQKVDYQEKRPENFAWVRNRTLFLGLNLVGSSVHDSAEWSRRLADDADWVEQQLNDQGAYIKAVVVFGHANMTEGNPAKFTSFTDRFRAAAKAFEKPILYLQGDGHFWFRNRPWPERNILRVQVEGGANAVQVTVDAGLEEPFAFDREFLD